MPSHPKIVSVSTAPVNRAGIVNAIEVATGISDVAQPVPADGRGPGQPLGPGHPHVVGVDGVEQQRALQQVVAGVADHRQRDGRQGKVPEPVQHQRPEPGDRGGLRARHEEQRCCPATG